MSDKPSPPLKLAYLIDGLNGWLGRIIAWFTLFLVLGTAVVVVLRYGFGIGATALQEGVLYAHALVFMGASAWVLQRNGHVRVDIFFQQFSGRRQAVVELLGSLFLLLPVCLYLGWASWDYVTNSWATKEISNETGGLRFVYLQKSIILLLAAGMSLQGLSNLIKAAYVIAGRIPAPEVKHG